MEESEESKNILAFGGVWRLYKPHVLTLDAGFSTLKLSL